MRFHSGAWMLGLFMLIGALATAHRSAADEPLRVYYVGNSVTDTIRYNALADLASGRGHPIVWGRHMIPGAPLQWIFQHPDDGFNEAPFGRYREALGGFTWDVLSLQPFDRQLDDGPDSDLAIARNFIDLARAKSPDVQVYIYQRWPRRDEGPDKSLSLNYRAKWLRDYTGGYDGTNETHDYFETLVASLRKAYPTGLKPVLMVPVGDVLLELDDQMKAGRVPGFTSVEQFYADGIHFNNVGSYAVAMTFYATFLRDDPRGLGVGDYGKKLDEKRGDRPIDAELAAAIQGSAWSIVREHPLAGVKAP